MELLEVVIGGLSQSAAYAVMALGLALVYGVSRIFNWAYGSLFAWTAYVLWYLHSGAYRLSYALSAFMAIAFIALISAGIEKILVRPVRSRADWQTSSMMVTLGVALLLDNLALVAFGGGRKSLPPILTNRIEIGDFAVAAYQIVVLCVSVAVVIALDLWLRRSWRGKSLRAVSQDFVGAQVVGLDANRLFNLSFVVSGILVGVAAVLIAPLQFITPLSGWQIFLKAFVIVALGGLGNIKSVLTAAFFLGTLEAFVAWRVGYLWIWPFWLIALLVVLSVRARFGARIGMARTEVERA